MKKAQKQFCLYHTRRIKMNTFTTSIANDLQKSKKDALTDNGAITRTTSGQAHLDLFAIAGAARNAQDDVVKLFSKAYAEDKALALRIMLWTRDVRGGAGERQAFRNVLRHLSVNDPQVVDRLIPYVQEFGRWDDCIESLPTESYLFKTAALSLRSAIDHGNSLAAKWTPRKSNIAVALRTIWGMTPKAYRKYIVNATNVVETKMCSKEWSAIEYDKLPSLAGLRYQKAFAKNDSERYEAFKEKLVKGEVKINVATLFPHNIVSNLRHRVGNETVLNESWKALPNYLGEHEGKVLVMSDVSGSMQTGIGGNASCLDVSLALGIYTAERLCGPFKDLILTFSQNPAFHKLTGTTLSQRIENLSRAQWDMNTNLQAAFQLILETGSLHRVPQEDMPDTLIIVSDMQFDACGGGRTNFGAMKAQYKERGYTLPKVVFWNVNGKAGNNPVKFDADGTCMVSGYSPAILTSVLNGEDFDPMSMMLDAVGKERYAIADLVV